MRKQNSDFRTAFLSEAGNKLKNNDYFGFVELDEYACYVIADGITDLPDTDSARLAIETVILHFQESPSLSKRTMKRLISKANKALIGRESYKRQEASLTVIVTDYRKFRYGYLGNTRLRMYRGGQPFRQTEDMSLSQELVDQERISKDVLQKHEERNNLYSYLGRQGAKPCISKKIKLLDTDIITIYTRGIWENIDAAELDDVFSEADNEVQNSLDNIEDLLLSKQPGNLENYTFAAIFVNKVYSDPQRAKKRKKIILISVVVIVVITVIACICFFLYRRKQRQIADMNYYFSNTVTYAETGNFVRAQQECERAKELADAVKDKDMRSRLQEYSYVIETVILADENFSSGDYDAAQNYYTNAMGKTRYVDFVGEDYIKSKLDKIAEYASILDYIALGDVLAEKEEYEKAEKQYLLAKKLAVAGHYTEGKESAMAALEKLYEEWAEAREEQKQAADEQMEKEVAAAELIASGDKACLEQDFVGANVYYTMALTKYQEMGDILNEQYAKQKIDSVGQKLTEQEEKRKSVEEIENHGIELKDAGDYWGAKSELLQAMNLYSELGSDKDVERVSGLIAQIDMIVEQQQIAQNALEDGNEE